MSTEVNTENQEQELSPFEMAKKYPHFIHYDKYNVSLRFSIDTMSFYDDVSNLEVLKYLKGQFTNKTRFQARFIDLHKDVKNQKVDFDEKTGIYTFHWRFYSESAKISEKVQNRYLKWDWVDAERGPRDFIAFSIHAIPGDDYVDMYIYDICEEDETETMKQGWDKLMNRLQLLLG